MPGPGGGEGTGLLVAGQEPLSPRWISLAVWALTPLCLPSLRRLRSESSGWEQRRGSRAYPPLHPDPVLGSNLEPLRLTAPRPWALGPFALQGRCYKGQLPTWMCEHVHCHCHGQPGSRTTGQALAQFSRQTGSCFCGRREVPDQGILAGIPSPGQWPQQGHRASLRCPACPGHVDPVARPSDLASCVLRALSTPALETAGDEVQARDSLFLWLPYLKCPCSRVCRVLWKPLGKHGKQHPGWAFRGVFQAHGKFLGQTRAWAQGRRLHSCGPRATPRATLRATLWLLPPVRDFWVPGPQGSTRPPPWAGAGVPSSRSAPLLTFVQTRPASLSPCRGQAAVTQGVCVWGSVGCATFPTSGPARRECG